MCETLSTTPTIPTPTTWERFKISVSEILRQLLTGRDNKTHDVLRHGAAFSLIWIMAHDAYQLSHGVQTNVKDVAQALAMVITAAGAAIYLKKDTEPQ